MVFLGIPKYYHKINKSQALQVPGWTNRPKRGRLWRLNERRGHIHTSMHHRRSFFAPARRHLGILICLTLLLAACEIEGGAPRVTDLAPTLNPLPTSDTAASLGDVHDDTWTIGLMDEPK